MLVLSNAIDVLHSVGQSQRQCFQIGQVFLGRGPRRDITRVSFRPPHAWGASDDYRQVGVPGYDRDRYRVSHLRLQSDLRGHKNFVLVVLDRG